MQVNLPDFRGLGSADLLGLALDSAPWPEAETASQDLLHGSVGPTMKVHETFSESDAYDGPGDQTPAADFMKTQDLDSELRRLPIESELQPDSEAQPLNPLETISHISATQATAGWGGSNLAADVPTCMLDGSLDTAAIDDALRALPLETHDPEAGEDGDVCPEPFWDAAGGDESEDARLAALPQSFWSASVGLGNGEAYMDSQALDDALRALPLDGSALEDSLQTPLPEEPSKAQEAVPDTAAFPLQPDPGPHRTHLHHQQLQMHQHQQHGRSAPSEPSGWGEFDDFGGGSFDDELEDYLIAKAAEVQSPTTEQHQQQQPPDPDELDALITSVENGGGPSSMAAAALVTATSSQRGLLATAGAICGGSALRGGQGTGTAAAAAEGGRALDRSQETIQQAGRPQGNRPCTGTRGRPTMEELFGSGDDDNDGEAMAVAAAVATAAALPGAGRAANSIPRAYEQAEEDEMVVSQSPPRSSYFPPQRLASSIQNGIAVPVTAVSGERVYCRMADAVDGGARGSAIGTGVGATAGRWRTGPSRLLAMPLSDMLRELEDRQLRAAVAASEREEERRRRQQQQSRHGNHFTEEERAFAGMAAEVSADLEQGLEEGAAAAPRGRSRRRVSGAPHTQGDTADPGEAAVLWVDKYAPRHFMSLLSDERTNRQVALWVKDWDECVFGRAAAAAAGGAAGTRAVPSVTRTTDSRPQQKVLLIGGPPGLGKTTLAHIVARHCGYHPYEINASDDRTAATLLTKIQDAVQMKAVLGGGRPNCIIVDEVDGATGGSETGGAVAALLKLIRAGEGGGSGKGAVGKASGHGRDGEDEGTDGEDDRADGGGKTAAGAGTKRNGAGGGRKASRQRPLCRPIICICNDLYAPALRPLRDVARVFHFSPPASERLLARLEQICRSERLEADPAALRLLVERTDRDVRSCLNTLQFLARRAASAPAATEAGTDGNTGRRRTIEMKDIESLNIASKDTTQSAMDVWSMLLTTARAGHRRGPAVAGGCSLLQQQQQQLVDLCNLLHDFGDYDLVLNGLHENLPRVRFMDMNFSRTAAVEEAMGLVDVMLRSCRRTGDFSALRFVPPQLAKIRSLVAQTERPRQLSWPRLGAEAARRASAAAQLVRSWASGRGTDPSVVAAHGLTVMLLELAPALRILASRPPVRAVAPHMMKADEQAVLRRTAGIMLHYGLRYCFESPTPLGLQPLQLPELVAPVSNNAIILGLTTEVQHSIAAAAGAPGVFQRQAQQPYAGRGSGGSFQGGRGGRGQYNSYGRGRSEGDGGFRVPYSGVPWRGAGGGGQGASPQGAMASAAVPAGVAPSGQTRHVPLVPAIDTLHLFTAFAGAAAMGARVTVPAVVRQMISQETEMEAIRRAEAARMAVANGVSSSQDPAEPTGAGCRGSGGPLQPMAPLPPPQRQMAGRMPPSERGKKGAAAAGGSGAKRKGTWMDCFKQQASAKARGGVGSNASAGAAARKAEHAAGSPGAVDEAGRVASPQGGGAGAEGQGRLAFRVLYRFNEGYTNAVKRPLLMRELL